MTRGRRIKVFFAVLVLILVALFVPPQINGNRFSHQLAASLSAALGRQVTIGSVSFRVLPRPGFDLHDFEVADDPQFSHEPLILCGTVTADLRMSSLWRGRLEIANLKLQESDNGPPSLNLVYWNGHWNVESLLLRAGQTPSAPTTKRSSERRYRFPYIEASQGRINFKVGAEKKPYALINSDFAVWLAQEDLWHFRLEGRPVRTDMSSTDTGTLQAEGDLKRTQTLRELPVEADLEWKGAQLGQVTQLITGSDKGWRGAVRITAHLNGSPADLHLRMEAALEGFRRFDIERNRIPVLRARCQGELVQEVVHLDCGLPLGGGNVQMAGSVATGGGMYVLDMVGQRIPMDAVANLAVQAKRTLPGDLTAEGELNGAVHVISGPSGPLWSGSAATSAVVIRSSAAATPISTGQVRFQIVGNQVSGRLRSVAKLHADTAGPAVVTILPFAVRLSPEHELEISGQIDFTGYHLRAAGKSGISSLMGLGRVAGFPLKLADVEGEADVALQAEGQWAGFRAPVLTGKAHLTNIKARLPGVTQPLSVSRADASLEADGSLAEKLSLTNITGRFQETNVGFTGRAERVWPCAPEQTCPVEFSLHSDSLSAAELGSLVRQSDSGWNLPLFSRTSLRLPSFQAHGTIAAGTVHMGAVPLQDFSADVVMQDRSLQLRNLTATLAGGVVRGQWTLDSRNSKPQVSGAGSFISVFPEKVPLSPRASGVITSWIRGKLNADYVLRFSASDLADVVSTLEGQITFRGDNVVSRNLSITRSAPMSCGHVEGALQVKDGQIRLLPSKCRAEDSIYTAAGLFSLGKNETAVQVTTRSNLWEISGTLDNPKAVLKPVVNEHLSRSQ